MKTLSIPEALRDLASVLEQAIAGEEIGIRSGDQIVRLHPAETSKPILMSPQEAFDLLQKEAHLTPEQAQDYSREVRAERIAASEKLGTR